MKRHIFALLILACIAASAAAQTTETTQTIAIRPGMYADIIATQGDPLEDVGALKQVSFVMRYGAIVKDEKR
jgi:imidazolonepropionase-like amidohydrolase